MNNTYDNENDDELGVQPLVYLVPKDRIKDIHYYAEQAHNDFHSEEINIDYFENVVNSLTSRNVYAKFGKDYSKGDESNVSEKISQ